MGALIEEWTKLASHGPEYLTGEFTPDAFWRKCVEDSTLRWGQTPASLSYYHTLSVFFGQQFLHHLVSKYRLEDSQMREHFESSGAPAWINSVIATLMKDADAAKPNWLSEGLRNTDPDAVPAFLSTCTNRKFFVTTNSYFGIGPVDAQVGDEIHILSGARVPFFL